MTAVNLHRRPRIRIVSRVVEKGKQVAPGVLRAPASTAPVPEENRRIAERLREAADLLQARGATHYAVSAYRNAAEAVASHPRDVRRIHEAEGLKGLDAIPRIGLGIASAIAEMLATEHWARLEDLRGAADPEVVLRRVPGVGPALARRIRDTLHVETLEGLDAAAHDGRLERLRGVGRRRAAALRASLDDMLGHSRRPTPRAREIAQLQLALALDRGPRDEASAGSPRHSASPEERHALRPDHAA